MLNSDRNFEDEHGEVERSPLDFDSLKQFKENQDNHVNLVKTLESVIVQQNQQIRFWEQKVMDLNANLETICAEKTESFELLKLIQQMGLELQSVNLELTSLESLLLEKTEDCSRLLLENSVLRGFSTLDQKVLQCATIDFDLILDTAAEQNTANAEFEENCDLTEKRDVLGSQLLMLQGELKEKVLKYDTLQAENKALLVTNEALMKQLDQSEVTEKRIKMRLSELVEENEQGKTKYQRDVMSCMSILEERQSKIASMESDLERKTTEIDRLQMILRTTSEENESLKQKSHDFKLQLDRKESELQDSRLELEQDQERFEIELKEEKLKKYQIEKQLKLKVEELHLLEDEICQRDEKLKNWKFGDLVNKMEADKQSIIERKNEKINELRGRIERLESKRSFSMRNFVDFEMEQRRFAERNLKLSLMNEVLQHYINNQSDHLNSIRKALKECGGSKYAFLKKLRQENFGAIYSDVAMCAFHMANWNLFLATATSNQGTQTVQTISPGKASTSRITVSIRGLAEAYSKSAGVEPDTFIDKAMFFKLYEFIRQTERYLAWRLAWEHQKDSNSRSDKRKEQVKHAQQDDSPLDDQLQTTERVLESIEKQAAELHGAFTNPFYGSIRHSHGKMKKRSLHLTAKNDLKDATTLLQTSLELKKFFILSFC